MSVYIEQRGPSVKARGACMCVYGNDHLILVIGIRRVPDATVRLPPASLLCFCMQMSAEVI